jgi:exonuclease III
MDKIPDEAIHCLGMQISFDLTEGMEQVGGVALLINSKIPFKICDDMTNPSFESLCMGNYIRPKCLPREISRIFICCVYLPPSQSDMDSFYDYVYNCYDKLCLESPNSGFIVAGDFNPISTEFQSERLKIHCNEIKL